MATKPELTDTDRKALKQIRELLRKYPAQYGRLDDPLTQRYAQELLHFRPSEAIVKAEEFRQEVKARNDQEEELAAAAEQRRAELRARPIYSLGYAGLIGVLLRSFVASINWTPLSSPNWYELTDRGLIVHTPLANVTERVVTHRDLQEKRLELGVNPPVYLDRLIGFLKQLRINYRTPWGQITLREPGSGVVLAEVVEIRPDEKLAQIRADLAALHRAADPYANHLILPKLVDFFSYYIDEWDDEYRLYPPLATEVAENTSEEA
ncbi:MAG: hypothetical protein DCC55_08950 [Chloroflexi bacterium]|nr:MAG: hypothetical protein DCC55_08950 [Chloroflexota bacterium]